MVGKKSNKRKLLAYNKALGLFSLLLMLKKSISGNLESMASTYAKICWIVAYFSTLFLILKKKTFSGHKIVTLTFISLSISVLPEVFDLFNMMQNSRKHLPCPVYKNAIKSPYEVITLTFHLLFNFKHGLSTLNTQYNWYLYKTWRNQRYSWISLQVEEANIRNGTFSWSKSYDSCKRTHFKTNTLLGYYPLPLASIFLKWKEVKIITNSV